MVKTPSRPPWTASASSRADTLRELNAYLTSAVCHLLALVLMGLLAAAARHDDAGIRLTLQLGDAKDVFAGDEGPLPGEEELGAAVEPPQTFDFQVVATTESAAVDVPLESLADMDAPFNDKDVAREIDRSLESTIGRGGGGLGESGDGADAWSGKGSPAGREQGFFGIGDSGKSFVYVVDCSDSMNERGKFARAKYELLRSLEQLASDQRYFVIFYSDRAYPMDADKPVAATEEELARTTEWINDVEAGGGTNPLPALLFALSLQPDAVYFLSDGQFDPQTILELRGRNRDNRRLNLRRIPIHTIAFVDRRAEGLMKTIARNSGGQYRFVK